MISMLKTQQRWIYKKNVLIINALGCDFQLGFRSKLSTHLLRNQNQNESLIGVYLST